MLNDLFGSAENTHRENEKEGEEEDIVVYLKEGLEVKHDCYVKNSGNQLEVNFEAKRIAKDSSSDKQEELEADTPTPLHPMNYIPKSAPPAMLHSRKPPSSPSPPVRHTVAHLGGPKRLDGQPPTHML